MLQPTGMAVLDQLRLGDAARAQGARIDRLFGLSDQTRVALRVDYAALEGDAHGIGIHRASLFAILHDAVRAAGIAIETGRTLAAAPLEGTKRRLAFAEGDNAGPFDLIVDALGTRSPLAPRTGRDLAYGALWASLDWPAQGFDPHQLEQRYHRARQMVGVLPIGTPPDAGQAQAAFFWSLRGDALAAWHARGLATWKAEVRALWPATAPLLDQIATPDQLTFARYAHRTLARPAEPALIHLGDAWHSASPQLGQGANMALLDAWALRQGLRGADDLPAALTRTVTLRRSHVRLYQWLTALVTPAYQSDGPLFPFARDRLVGPLAHWRLAQRVQARLVSGLVGNPLVRLDLA